MKLRKFGIERINVVGNVFGAGAWRFKHPKRFYADVHQIYRAIFPILPGCVDVNVTKEERYARYDIDFGVDVILNFVNGQSATIQEKVLSTTYSTVTVEYYQNPMTEEEGDWFNLKCDYYFVGYGPKEGTPILDRWILLDWNQVRLHSASIPWKVNNNQKDNARANFVYAHFSEFPNRCVVARKMNGCIVKNTPDFKSYKDLQLPL